MYFQEVCKEKEKQHTVYTFYFVIKVLLSQEKTVGSLLHEDTSLLFRNY